ncbi:30088_t:CDS:2, partial [Gigaspora margarita]
MDTYPTGPAIHTGILHLPTFRHWEGQFTTKHVNPFLRKFKFKPTSTLITPERFHFVIPFHMPSRYLPLIESDEHEEYSTLPNDHVYTPNKTHNERFIIPQDKANECIKIINDITALQNKKAMDMNADIGPIDFDIDKILIGDVRNNFKQYDIIISNPWFGSDKAYRKDAQAAMKHVYTQAPIQYHMNTKAGFDAITPHFPDFTYTIIHSFEFSLPQEYAFQTEQEKTITVVLYQSIFKSYKLLALPAINTDGQLEDIQDTLDHFWSFYLNSPDQSWNLDPTKDISEYYDDKTILEINMHIITSYIRDHSNSDLTKLGIMLNKRRLNDSAVNALVKEWLPIEDPNNPNRSAIAKFLDESYKHFLRIFGKPIVYINNILSVLGILLSKAWDFSKDVALYILDVGSAVIDYIFQQNYSTHIKAVWAATNLKKTFYSSRYNQLIELIAFSTSEIRKDPASKLRLFINDLNNYNKL